MLSMQRLIVFSPLYVGKMTDIKGFSIFFKQKTRENQSYCHMTDSPLRFNSQ